ncbi:MAG: chemotaxis protein CheW [Microcystaceae cyanobacterium]
MVSQAPLGTQGEFSPSKPLENQDKAQFLRFFLMPDTHALLPIAQLTEVLNVPIQQIIPIPQMPNWVMGVHNWRGEVLWLVDLGHLLGLTPWYQQGHNRSTCRAIVIHPTSHQLKKSRNRSQMLGLVVHKVEDIAWCHPNDIQSPPDSAVTPELAPFLRGYLLTEIHENEVLVALDGEAILAAMPQA